MAKELDSFLAIIHLIPITNVDLYNPSVAFICLVHRTQGRATGAEEIPNHNPSLYLTTNTNLEQWMHESFSTMPDHQTVVPAFNRQVVPELHVSISFSLVARQNSCSQPFSLSAHSPLRGPSHPLPLSHHSEAPQPDSHRRGSALTHGSSWPPSPRPLHRSHWSSTISASIASHGPCELQRKSSR
jgi:hypothetical protein